MQFDMQYLRPLAAWLHQAGQGPGNHAQCPHRPERPQQHQLHGTIIQIKGQLHTSAAGITITIKQVKLHSHQSAEQVLSLQTGLP